MFNTNLKFWQQFRHIQLGCCYSNNLVVAKWKQKTLNTSIILCVCVCVRAGVFNYFSKPEWKHFGWANWIFYEFFCFSPWYWNEIVRFIVFSLNFYVFIFQKWMFVIGNVLRAADYRNWLYARVIEPATYSRYLQQSKRDTRHARPHFVIRQMEDWPLL